jgi:hypothetical protein
MITKLTQKRGDSVGYTLYFTEDNVIVNITGWAIFFTLKKNWRLPDSEASLRIVNTSHSNPTLGQTTITILPSHTINLEPGDYEFDIQALTNTGAIYTPLEGKYTLTHDNTHGTAGT